MTGTAPRAARGWRRLSPSCCFSRADPPAPPFCCAPPPQALPSRSSTAGGSLAGSTRGSACRMPQPASAVATPSIPVCASVDIRIHAHATQVLRCICIHIHRCMHASVYMHTQTDTCMHAFTQLSVPTAAASTVTNSSLAICILSTLATRVGASGLLVARVIVCTSSDIPSPLSTPIATAGALLARFTTLPVPGPADRPRALSHLLVPHPILPTHASTHPPPGPRPRCHVPGTQHRRMTTQHRALAFFHSNS